MPDQVSLPRLPRSSYMVDNIHHPTLSFQVWWNTFALAIEKALNDIIDQQVDITQAQADITAAQADIATAQTDIATAQTDIATAQATIATQQTEIETAQDDITSAQADIASAQTTIASQQTAITAAQADIADAQADIASQQADIEAAQADILEALATMPPVPDIHVPADFTGVVDSDDLPVTAQFTRFSGSTDVTDSSTWSRTVVSGSITCSVSSIGTLTVTALGSTSVVTVTSVKDSISRSQTITVWKDVADPPASGGGGGGGGGTSTATDSTFFSVNSTTYAVISDELTVTVGSSGTVTCAAPLSVRTATATPTGTFPVDMKWQWWNGSSWTDLGTSANSNPDCSVDEVFIGDEPSLRMHSGTMSLTRDKTGLTVASSQKFRLLAKNTSGTRTMTFAGTASVTSS